MLSAITLLFVIVFFGLRTYTIERRIERLKEVQDTLLAHSLLSGKEDGG